MKKLLGIITIALLAVAWTCHAVDYSKHFYNQRVYRVALGSGTAPSADDLALVRLQNGDMVLNTDDDVLYIMHATNVYTKMTAAGAITPGSGFVAGSLAIASNKVLIGSSAGVGAAQTLSGDITATVGGVVAIGTSKVTGGMIVDGTISNADIGAVSAAKLTAGTVLSAVDASAVTNISQASLAVVIRSGTCTNDQTISFSPALTQTPTVVGTWVGAVGAVGTNWPVLYLSEISVNQFKLSSAAPQTNNIYWLAY